MYTPDISDNNWISAHILLALTVRSDRHVLRVHPRKFLLHLSSRQKRDFGPQLSAITEADGSKRCKLSFQDKKNLQMRTWATPLGVVVLLQDVGHLLAGQEQVSCVIELQVHGVFVQQAQMLLTGNGEGFNGWTRRFSEEHFSFLHSTLIHVCQCLALLFLWLVASVQ